MLLRWVYALKVKFNLTAPALHYQCVVPTRILLLVSGVTQTGFGCGRPASLRSFVLEGGLCLLRCVLQGSLHIANQFVGFVVASFGQDRIENASEFSA